MAIIKDKERTVTIKNTWLAVEMLARFGLIALLCLVPSPVEFHALFFVSLLATMMTISKSPEQSVRSNKFERLCIMPLLVILYSELLSYSGYSYDLLS